MQNAKEKSRISWYFTLLERAIHKTESIPDALAVANYAYSLQSSPADIFLGFDIFNRRAQGVLNKTLEVSKKLTAAGRGELEKILAIAHPPEMLRRLLSFFHTFRDQLARLLHHTQLAALLEGAVEVARHVDPSLPLGVVPPPSLSPVAASALLDRLRAATNRETEIAKLDPLEQAYVRRVLEIDLWKSLFAPPEIGGPAPGTVERVHFPVIEAAVRGLNERNLVGRDEFRRLDSAARSKAFTVAGVDTQATLDKIRKSLAESVREGVDFVTWRDKILAEVDEGTFLSDGHMCFLPGTLIEGNVVAASKIWYSGPAVEVETDDGRRLRVTVNHPILTTFGWKHAGDIEQGENLVCHGPSVESLDPLDKSLSAIDFAESSDGVAINNQKVPTRVEDVFQSFLGECFSGLFFDGPVSALDFHGDAAFTEGNVRCVRANGVLVRGLDSDQGKFGNQIGLVERNVTATNRIPGVGLGLFDSFCQRSPSPSRCFSRVGKNRFSTKRSLFWREHVPEHFVGFGTATDFDPCLFHASNKNPSGDVQLSRKLIVSFPHLITTNRVRKVKFITWTGHVYDLQTTTGFIVSQGIISSNSTVYRTNIQAAFSDGQKEVLENPFIRSAFPYASYNAIDDDRVRENHLALEKHGIQGSNIYRLNDPVLQTFLPPWDFNCRCSWVPLTVQQAAEQGIEEAKVWTATGIEPSPPAHVPMPPFQPDPAWQRSVAAAPLSIRMSFASLEEFQSEPTALLPPAPSPSYPRLRGRRVKRRQVYWRKKWLL
jgi:hypothetical protein